MKKAGLVLLGILVMVGLGVMGWVTIKQYSSDSPARPRGSSAFGTGEVAEVADANFAEFTGRGVALVDFWAPWCGPCRMQGLIVEELAGKFAGRVAVGKLNVDDNRATSGRFDIQCIPTLIVFRDGRQVQTLVGLQSEDAIVTELERVLAGR